MELRGPGSRLRAFLSPPRDPLARWRLLLWVSSVAIGTAVLRWLVVDRPGRWVLWAAVGAGLACLVALEVYGYTVVARTMRQNARTLQRERTLQRAGSALVGAQSREDIYRAVETALHDLGAEAPKARLSMWVGGPDRFRCVATAGDHADDLRGAEASMAETLPPRFREDLVAGRRARVDQINREPFRRQSVEAKQGPFLTFPLMPHGALGGVLVVAGDAPLPGWVEEGLDTLAVQTSLALESAALGEQFRSLVQNSSDVVTIVSPDGTVRYQSPSVEGVFGYPSESLTGSKISNVLHPEDGIRLLSFLEEAAFEPGATFTLEIRWRHGDGSWRHAETVVNNQLEDPGIQGLVLNTRDVTERHRLERELQHRALHDPLTDLANRALFKESVDLALARTGRSGGSVAVLFFDVDDFKDVNDSLGHAAGDRLLEAVAERLRASVRPYDVAARVGGDEFGVLLDEADAGTASRVANRILESLQEPAEVLGRRISVGASLGLAVATSADGGAEELLRNADVAMNMAKGRGKGRIEMYRPDMHTAALDRMELVADLRRAVDEGEFVLHYQPFVSLDDGSITGVEALLRWVHPRRGLVPPMEFIPTAEELGLIIPIGRWVLHEATQQAKLWQELHPEDPPLIISVNASAFQVQDPGFVSDVKAGLVSSGLDPRHLVLEITESVLVQDTDEVRNRLEALHGSGVRLAIDDFGTGYSSLSYLGTFPIDVLKIDRSFVAGAGSGGSSDLSAVMVSIGRTLGLETIAEGVEAFEEVKHLRALGCGAAQGFLFARPAPAAELDSLLEGRSLAEALSGAA
jgi:diguanylate cyclase (GGDEF)-like protein/PAS domain S-box-containing protein